MFKYLHRDGDGDIPLFDLIKREIREMKRQKLLAKDKFDKKTYRKFRKWITYYHKGMFFKPDLSREVKQIEICERENLILNFRKNQSDLYILQENFVSEIYDFDFEKYLQEVRVIFDLGANIGLSSIYFQYRFKNAHIFCIEPVEENIKMLFLNRNTNNFNWEIIKAAIQASDGTATLHPNEWWSSSTVLDCVANHRENTEGRLEKIYKLPKEQVPSYSISNLMKKYNIPTAGYENFDDAKKALAYLETAKFPIVLKADGLALGKGVLICNTLEEAKDGVQSIMLDKQFGTAGNTMVIEEFMTGREVSVLSFVDGNTIKTMTSAQDHKRAMDGDKGLNTGGMGTFSPSPFYTKEVEEFWKKYIYQATVDAMKAEGREFKGIIFFGLMLTEDGPKVLEYNARFGDPEAQVVLPRMKNDIIEVVEACIDGTLDQIDLQFEDNAAVCVVLASEGYPVKYDKGLPISGLEEFEKHDGYYCFHAGTKFEGDKIVTNGGRVLGVTAKGKDLKEARENAYKATEWVQFANKYKRNDIGKAIDEA